MEGPLAFKGEVSGKAAGVLPMLLTDFQKGAGLLCGRYWLGSLAVLGTVILGSRRCGAGV
jgi:hypothetical protein